MGSKAQMFSCCYPMLLWELCFYSKVLFVDNDSTFKNIETTSTCISLFNLPELHLASKAIPLVWLLFSLMMFQAPEAVKFDEKEYKFEMLNVRLPVLRRPRHGLLHRGQCVT